MAIVRDDFSDGEVIEIQLLSAIQRQDLTPLEEAHGYKALIDSTPRAIRPLTSPIASAATSITCGTA